MKKLIVISLLTLIVMLPSAVFAGDVYSSKVTADFKVSLSNSVRPKGNATITCDGNNWTVTLNMRGLLKNYSGYIFQFSIINQMIHYYDVELNPTDKKGNLVQTFTVSGVADNFPEDVYDVVRIIDKFGESGGQLISSVDQSTVDPDLPYLDTGTIVIRAREDCLGGCLIFY